MTNRIFTRLAIVLLPLLSCTREEPVPVEDGSVDKMTISAGFRAIGFMSLVAMKDWEYIASHPTFRSL